MGTDIEKLVDLMIQERRQSQFAKWREAETGTEKKEDCLRLENEYEKAIMFNTKLMKVFYIVLVIANLFVPLKKSTDGYVFSISIFNIIALGILFYALLIGLGYFRHNIPFLWLGVLRIVQGLYKFLIHPENFNWYGFLVLVLMDVFFIFFLLMDKRNYSYVEEEDDSDDLDDSENEMAEEETK